MHEAGLGLEGSGESFGGALTDDDDVAALDVWPQKLAHVIVAPAPAAGIKDRVRIAHVEDLATFAHLLDQGLYAALPLADVAHAGDQIVAGDRPEVAATQALGHSAGVNTRDDLVHEGSLADTFLAYEQDAAGGRAGERRQDLLDQLVAAVGAAQAIGGDLCSEIDATGAQHALVVIVGVVKQAGAGAVTRAGLRHGNMDRFEAGRGALIRLQDRGGAPLARVVRERRAGFLLDLLGVLDHELKARYAWRRDDRAHAARVLLDGDDQADGNRDGVRRQLSLWPEVDGQRTKLLLFVEDQPGIRSRQAWRILEVGDEHPARALDRGGTVCRLCRQMRDGQDLRCDDAVGVFLEKETEGELHGPHSGF